MYIDPYWLEAPLSARLVGVAIIFACLYVADYLATSRRFNLRAFIAWTVGGTAAIFLLGELF